MPNYEQKEIGNKKLGILFNWLYIMIVAIRAIIVLLTLGKKLKQSKQGLGGETNTTF